MNTQFRWCVASKIYTKQTPSAFGEEKFMLPGLKQQH
jgi:hypothetical protein